MAEPLHPVTPRSAEDVTTSEAGALKRRIDTLRAEMHEAAASAREDYVTAQKLKEKIMPGEREQFLSASPRKRAREELRSSIGLAKNEVEEHLNEVHVRLDCDPHPHL